MIETMSKVNLDDYSGYEDEFKERPKPHRKKKGPPTKADKARREEEINAAREARAKEAKERIKRHLSSFPDIETKEGKNKAEIYTRWVEESLKINCPLLADGDVEVKASLPKVKAGGQHMQKRLTAVRVTHLPTSISVRNEQQRNKEQNEQAAKAILFTRLEEHLGLWKTLIKNSTSPVNVEEEVISLLQTKNS